MTRTSAFFDATNESQAANIGLPADFQDVGCCAMDQALGLEKVSVSAIARLNSSALEIYTSFAPAYSEFLDRAAKAFAFFMDLQMSWLTLMFPYAKLGSEKLLHGAASDSTFARDTEKHEQPIVEAVRLGAEIEVGVGTSAGLD